MAKVYNKGGTDKNVILGVREDVVQGFDAPDWLDLRVGFLLSATQAGADDTITGLTETITGAPTFSIDKFFFVGLKDSSSLMPAQAGSVFVGFSNNFGGGPLGKGDSKLVSSDSAFGTTNSNFWRPTNSEGASYGGGIWDGLVPRGAGGDGTQVHLVQNTVGAGGYATLLAIRMTRSNPTSKSVTVTIKKDLAGHNGDVLYSNTPTLAVLETNLQSFPSTVQQWGPVTLSALPTALFAYWPFHNSRLRIHAMGFISVL